MRDQTFYSNSDVKITYVKLIVNDCTCALSPENPTETKPIDNGIRLLTHFKKRRQFPFAYFSCTRPDNDYL